MAWIAYPHDFEPDGETPQEVTEDEFRFTLEAATQNGVSRGSGPGQTDALQASVSGSTILVEAGRAQLNGYSVDNSEQDAVSAPENASSLPRRYRVVVRHDVAARTAQAAVVEGTAASSPQLPVLTRTDSVWEEPLASFRRGGNGGSIVDFSDDRVFLNPHGPVLCQSSARPLQPQVGHQAYELDTGRLVHWDGTSWVITADPAYPTAWTPIALSSGFSNLGGEGHGPSYRFLSPTRVELRGSLQRDDAPIPHNRVVARLPEGARPAAYTRQMAAAEMDSETNAVRLTIASVNATSWRPGEIYTGVINGYEPSWLYLDGIFFDTV